MNEAEVERGHVQCMYLRRTQSLPVAPCPLDLGRQVVVEVQMYPSTITVMQPETMILSKKNGQRNGADTGQLREPGMEVFATWSLFTYTR